MNENRRQILEMLAAGRITADEAERLMSALDKEPAAGPPANDASPRPKSKPKYLRVVVEGYRKDHPSQVNVRVPLQLLRAGVKLASLIPAPAQREVNLALGRHGMSVDLSQIKPENLDELIDQLSDLTVDVNDQSKTKVRLFCE